MGGIPPIVTGAAPAVPSGSPSVPVVSPAEAAPTTPAAAPTTALPTPRAGTPIEVGTVQLPAGASSERAAQLAGRLRQRLTEAQGELTRQQAAMRLVLQDAPRLSASYDRQTQRTGAGASTQLRYDSAANALNQALERVQASITAQIGISHEVRQDVLRLLRDHFEAHQVDAILHWLDARVATLDVVRAQVMVDALDGRIPPREIVSQLHSRLEAEVARSDDQMRAIIAPMDFFTGAARDLFARMRQRSQDSLGRLEQVALSTLQGAGVTDLTPMTPATVAPTVTLDTSGSMSMSRSRTRTTLSVEAPGYLTQRLLEWQQAGLIGPGEMDLVVRRIASGMESPTSTGDAVEDRLAQWAQQHQAVLLTPSVIHRLAERIRSGGLEVGGGVITSENLAARLERLREAAGFFEALDVSSATLWLEEVATVRERRQGDAVMVSGDLQPGVATNGAGQPVGSTGVGAAYVWGQAAETTEEIGIEAGVRRTHRRQQAQRLGFGVTGGVTATPAETRGGVGFGISF
jgi:hypothetical protein